MRIMAEKNSLNFSLGKSSLTLVPERACAQSFSNRTPRTLQQCLSLTIKIHHHWTIAGYSQIASREPFPIYPTQDLHRQQQTQSLITSTLFFYKTSNKTASFVANNVPSFCLFSNTTILRVTFYITINRPTLPNWRSITFEYNFCQYSWQKLRFLFFSSFPRVTKWRFQESFDCRSTHEMTCYIDNSFYS